MPKFDVELYFSSNTHLDIEAETPEEALYKAQELEAAESGRTNVIGHKIFVEAEGEQIT